MSFNCQANYKAATARHPAENVKSNAEIYISLELPVKQRMWGQSLVLIGIP